MDSGFADLRNTTFTAPREPRQPGLQPQPPPAPAQPPEPPAQHMGGVQARDGDDEDQSRARRRRVQVEWPDGSCNMPESWSMIVGTESRGPYDAMLAARIAKCATTTVPEEDVTPLDKVLRRRIF